MRPDRLSLKSFVLAATLLAGWTLPAPAQTAPGITNQPAGQTVPPGASVIFTVGASGTAPFSYQWSCNGTNFPTNLIATVVGNGSATNAGDGGPALSASLYYPEGITFDPAGNLYIADHFNNRVRKVGTNGIITTVAGNGTGTFAGDGGAATNASLYSPSTVTLDATGNLYICDQSNSRVRKVDTNGIISTVAGNGAYGFSGDGATATNASLNFPYGVSLDSLGNLYISDSYNNRIRRVNTNGIITTIAGKGASFPMGGGFSGDGGAATNANLEVPLGLLCDPSGNLWLADAYNGRIRKIATNGIITTIAGIGGSGSESGDGGAATNASLEFPFSLTSDKTGDLFISDYYGNCIREVFTNGLITTVAGAGTNSGDGGPATNALLNTPTGLAFDAAGNLWLADHGNMRIREINFAGQPALTLTNVGPANAGNYLVTVSSAYGSITSSIAVLTITIPTNPPQIYAGGTGFGLATNQSGFGFNFSGLAGQTIVIDASTNLITWTPLFTNTATGTNAIFFLDPVASNFPARYYRARLP